jgi:hypothetical protein
MMPHIVVVSSGEPVHKLGQPCHRLPTQIQTQHPTPSTGKGVHVAARLRGHQSR